MSSKVTINQSKGVRVVGILAIIAGIILVLGGGAAYALVSDQLRAEKITVSEDADFLAGKRVQGPLTAYAQAEVINKHALAGSGGKTYAELEQDDPARETMMNASFLRTSLFTSVVSFGLAILVMGLGLLFILIGWALRRMTAGPAIVVENFDQPVGRHVSGAEAEALAAASSSGPSPIDAVEQESEQPTAAARVPRRSATVSGAQDDEADTRSLGGASIAEALSRHSRSVNATGESDTTGYMPPVAADEAPAVQQTDQAHNESLDAAVSPDLSRQNLAELSQSALASASEPEATSDSTQASGSIPVPPRQSWRSPAERAVPSGDEADPENPAV